MKHTLYALIVLAGCGPKSAPVDPASTPADSDGTSISSIVLGDMDLTADPCTDFYQYACGSWIDRTELPADKPSWTRSFSVIAEQNRTFLRSLLERAAQSPESGDEDWAKMGRYYGACMDEAGIETAGLTGVQPLLDQIDAVTSADQLMPLLAQLHSANVNAFFSPQVEGDFKNPQLTILHLGQGGIGLPDRDYYLKTDEKSTDLLVEYQHFIQSILALSGTSETDAAAWAPGILALETALATAHKPRSELRDPTAIYHKIDRTGLIADVGVVDWAAWLEASGGADIQDINVETLEVLAATANLMQTTDLAVVKAYLRWRTIEATSAHLPNAFVDASFGFYGKKVYGQQENEARWKRCVRSTDSALGEIVGRYFIEEKFAGDSKDKAVQMIEGIQKAFEEQLPELAWMDEQTRARAIEKKDTLVNMIGYPDKWREYPFAVTGDNHLANVLASRSFETDDAIGRVGNPTDSTRWYMSPPQVNAYYHPLYNQMVFPAGILQPPFFDAAYPMAMNFGGIGMVMGHELTHGFDDSGRMFDPQGRMEEWWAPEASERFDEAASCVEEQFNGYQVADELNVNGKLTLGENIADLGGLKSTFRAWKAHEAAVGTIEPAVEGLTNDQLLFVAFAQGWCSISAPEYEKMLVLSNSHSPPQFRVNGPVRNLPEFHETFSCPVGSALRPEDFCTVW